MTDLEAIARLQHRARRFARPLQIASAFAMIAIALLVYFLTLFGQLLLTGGEAWPLASGLAAAGAASVVPSTVNWYIRTALHRRRARWIDELVHSEGVSRAELEECFTLESW